MPNVFVHVNFYTLRIAMFGMIFAASDIFQIFAREGCFPNKKELKAQIHDLCECRKEAIERIMLPIDMEPYKTASKDPEKNIYCFAYHTIDTLVRVACKLDQMQHEPDKENQKEFDQLLTYITAAFSCVSTIEDQFKLYEKENK